MRKVSLTLGIIGSILVLVVGCFTVYDACFRTFWDDLYGYNDDYYSDEYYFDDYYYDGEYDSLAAEDALPDDSKDSAFVEPYIDPFSVTSGCSMILGGLLGVIGSLLMKRSNTSAGILYIIASVLTVPSSAFIGGVLLVIAAIFALKRERPAGPAMYAPGYYPAYPYYGEYPPYGSYPPPYSPPIQSPPAVPAAPTYPPYGSYPPPYSPPIQPSPAGPKVPAYPPYGAYPPHPTAPPPYAPQAYAPYSSYPPPPPAYSSAWPPAPVAHKPAASPVPSGKEQP